MRHGPGLEELPVFTRIDPSRDCIRGDAVQIALFILIVCVTVDLIACAVLLAFVWVEHNRVRREAATTGEVVPSAAGQFGCLFALGLIGFVMLYGVAWLLLSE